MEVGEPVEHLSVEWGSAERQGWRLGNPSYGAAGKALESRWLLRARAGKERKGSRQIGERNWERSPAQAGEDPEARVP